MARIVIALGGNALGESPSEQMNLVKDAVKVLIDIVQAGHELIVTHGNGPQVGMINAAFECAKDSINTPQMPFAECGAMSQGYIGYHLQNALQEELAHRMIKKDAASVITQVVVDAADTAFLNPTKPIGTFFSKEEADSIAKDTGYTFVEDSGRGYRRVIASPKPLDIVEKNIITKIVSQGDIVVCCGGGGIPVTKTNNSLTGIACVIDKDAVSELAAELLDADMLLILTAVDRVAIRYGTPEQEDLKVINTEQTLEYIEQGHFAPGSMLPKVESCLKFVQSRPGRSAIICSLEKASLALSGESGTKITS